MLAGASYGGLTAVYAGLRYPDVFGCILSQSGSFWWSPPDRPENGWLAQRIERSPRLPLRFYLEVGLLEDYPSPGRAPSQLATNRCLRDVLIAKGYKVTYSEYCGGHDYAWWRGTLGEGLIALLTAPGERGR